MIFRTILFLALLGGISILTDAAHAQSLWQQRKSSKAFLVYDTQARQVCDILTVLVNEVTDVENRDARALDRSAEAGGGFSLSAALGGDLGSKNGTANFSTDANGNGKFDANSNYSVERGFTDRITVTVVEQLPNGNLVIRGNRDHRVTGERRALSLYGIVRQLDIRADNSIESQYIADLKLCYDGDGIESKFNEEGWMTRAWNKYRPL